MSRPRAPKVTVVTPVYNQAGYLADAVESVVAQTMTDWELIIVDDGSPDSAAEVAARLIAAHPGRAIRLLRQENQGLGSSRNNGIRAGRGAYILPLDADDAIEPEMLAATCAVLDARQEVGFVYCDVRRFGGEDTLLRCRPYSLERLRFDNLMMPATLFRRAAWEQTAGFRSGMRYEDWDFWLSLAEAGWEGAHVPRPLIRYRRSATGMLSVAQRQDLVLRAQIVLNHHRLYEPALVTWARVVASPAFSDGGELRSPGRRLIAYLGYALLIARYRPGLLSRALLRPLFWRLPVRLQGAARQLAR